MDRGDGQSAAPARDGVALLLASAGVTAYQLSLMQLFAYVQWYHFAYMMVSLALLGFGASGVALTLGWRAFRRRPRATIRVAWLLAGLGMPGVLALMGHDWLRFDVYLLFVEGGQWPRSIGSTLLLFGPFFAAALGIGGLLTSRADAAPKLYCADLLGSGAGGALGIALAELVLPGRGAGICGLCLMAASAVLPGAPAKRAWRWARFAAPAAAAVVCVWPPQWDVSQFKSLSQALDTPGAEVAAERPSAQGIAQRVKAPTLHTAPGLSLNYAGEVPPGDTIFVDGHRVGALQPLAFSGRVWEEATTEARAYDLRPRPERALLLAPGGASPFRLAFAREAGEVAAVAPHPVVASWLREALAASGRANWRLRVRSPRVALEGAGDSFDLIRFPDVGQFHGGVGLGSLGANFLLTTEAFREGLRRLSPDGLLVVNAWLDFPTRKPLRLLNTLMAAARAAGWERPGRHLAAIRGWSAMTFMLSARPLRADELDRLAEACERWAFDPLWLGGRENIGRERHHAIESRALFALTDAIVRGDPEGKIADYPFALEPATDERPFFSQFLRLRSLSALERAFGRRTIPFFELGTWILVATLGLLAVFASCFVIAPLLFRRLASPGRGATVAYFAALGLGFLFVEIALMQVFHLIWGNPILAAGGTIGGMLAFSGWGSLASRKCAPGGRLPPALGLGVCLLLLFAAFGLTALARWLAGAGPELRYPAAVALLAAFSFPLGFFLPTGLRLLERRRPDHLPWAWAINGSFSVIASPLALLACVLGGFDHALAAAAACYGIAALALRRLRVAR